MKSYFQEGKNAPKISIYWGSAAEFLKDVLRAQNLVVLKTSPGHANSVAVALDNEGWPEVVGTIAGDDTILVITLDTPTGEAIQEKLLDLVEKG